MPGLRHQHQQRRAHEGKPIAAGTTANTSVPYTFTVTHEATVNVRADDFLTGIELYTGAMEQPEFQLDNCAVPDCLGRVSKVDLAMKPS